MGRSLPARFPLGSAWPAEMLIDMAAGYLDFSTTGKLIAAIRRGESPGPTATRLLNGRRIPVWSRAACDAFLQRRHDLAFDVIPANDNRRTMEVELA